MAPFSALTLPRLEDATRILGEGPRLRPEKSSATDPFKFWVSMLVISGFGSGWRATERRKECKRDGFAARLSVFWTCKRDRKAFTFATILQSSELPGASLRATKWAFFVEDKKRLPEARPRDPRRAKNLYRSDGIEIVWEPFCRHETPFPLENLPRSTAVSFFLLSLFQSAVARPHRGDQGDLTRQNWVSWSNAKKIENRKCTRLGSKWD